MDLGLNDRRVDLIEEGWDLAIRIGVLPDSSLIARHLAPCRIVVCAAPGYLAEHGTPGRPDDLSRHNCLGYSIVDADRWRVGNRSIPVSGNLRASNGDALLAAAVAGQGVVCQPTFIVGEALRAGALVEIDLGERPPPLPIHALMPPGRRPAKTQAFLAFLVGCFGPDPAWDRDLPSPVRAT